MDERDLRKGNLVLAYGLKSIVNYCCGGWLDCILPSGGCVGFSCSDAEPVVVTEDFLEESNFSRNERSWGVIFEKTVGECHVTLGNDSNKDGCDWSVHIDNNRFESIGGANIQYVHELQNIIRLCTGEDLEVKTS